MLYSQNLEEIIFHRHEIVDTDELIVLSGYVGPNPINRLRELPFNSRVIYGMYGSEGIKRSLHHSLLNIQNNTENLNIYYSKLPIHSKCYVWRRDGRIVHALIGSANFSVNGLTTPLREILAETTVDTFQPLNEYLLHIINNSLSCLEHEVEESPDIRLNDNVCVMTLLMDNGEVHNASGLNWGYEANGLPARKRKIDDACIPIRTEHIRHYPEFFPPKLLNRPEDDNRGRRQRHNEAIEIIWDDGVVMEGLLEGTQPVDGVIYPKQISSFPIKAQLGEYIKQRINVPLGQPVRTHHLRHYGRTDITLSMLSEGVYKLDFSV